MTQNNEAKLSDLKIDRSEKTGDNSGKRLMLTAASFMVIFLLFGMTSGCAHNVKIFSKPSGRREAQPLGFMSRHVLSPVSWYTLIQEKLG